MYYNLFRCIFIKMLKLDTQYICVKVQDIAKLADMKTTFNIFIHFFRFQSFGLYILRGFLTKISQTC